MPININGTTGISGVDGSASAPALQGTDANTGVHFPAADTVAISTNGSQRVTVNSSGNVGIGTTSPNQPLEVNGTIRGGSYQFSDSGTSVASYIGFSNSNGPTAEFWGSASANAGSLLLKTAGSERARIDSSGLIYVNRTSLASGFTSYLNISHSGGSQYGVMLQNTSTSQSNALSFLNSSGSAVGTVVVTTTSTSYGTSSDYRLKENVTAVTDGITRLQQLKPSRFNFIADPDRIVDGFIAHEVQAVVPEAITGEKDAVDDDGNPIYQGIDQSKLVPLLTAALQEAVAKIETLEARLTAAGIA